MRRPPCNMALAAWQQQGASLLGGTNSHPRPATPARPGPAARGGLAEGPRLQVDHGLGELLEGGRRVAAEQLRARGHLLLAHQETLVVALRAARAQLSVSDKHRTQTAQA